MYWWYTQEEPKLYWWYAQEEPKLYWWYAQEEPKLYWWYAQEEPKLYWWYAQEEPKLGRFSMYCSLEYIIITSHNVGLTSECCTVTCQESNTNYTWSITPKWGDCGEAGTLPPRRKQLLMLAGNVETNPGSTVYGKCVLHTVPIATLTH